MAVIAIALVLLFGLAGAEADDGLTGDWGGLRKDLAKNGFELGIVHIGETFGDLAGGIHRGTAYEGRLAIALDIDLGKLAGWRGATAHASSLSD